MMFDAMAFKFYPIYIKHQTSHIKVAPTRKTGGSADGYKPLLLKASVSRRWLSLCSSHCAFHSSRIPKGIAPTQIRT